MTPVKIKILIPCFLILFLNGQFGYANTLSVSNNASGDIIALGGDIRCPYICDPKSGSDGFLIDVIKAIFNETGHRIQYRRLPWKRAIIMTKLGNLDGLLGVSIRNATNLIVPEEEQAFSQIRFFVNEKNPWQYSGIVSLLKTNIIVELGRSYGELDMYINKYSESDKVKTIAGSDITRRMIKTLDLNHGVVLEDHFVMNYFLDLMNKKEKVKCAGRLSGENLYIAFSPQNPQSQKYADLVSKKMTELRKSGKLNMILKKYGLSDWKDASFFGF